ncbi:NUDIX hydrolase [Neotamlana laminarinivorans]|uniref:CoA pyrophosphatase n=1 Tax=Neotamlana laminarinivorans TaxID=2883124 RepID=A0A9X1L1N6_9FLAO|nr:CoA pyrophosphatase [Tamlana laminarinivorans]MCB4798913.1 CoA pyrophosphatase [Tamlana laminarinivorans]
MNFNDFLIVLSKIKNKDLLGQASQFKMVPPFRQELLKKQKHQVKEAKKAGVLALFYPDMHNNTKFVLILRKTYKGVHSAQVAFPGGKFEEIDASIQQTALRETFEEVGVPQKSISVVRALSQVYIPPSNFNVHPFLAYTTATPKFIKEESEVEAILQINVKEFLNDKSLVVKTLKTSYSQEVEVPAFLLNKHIVWGATAMMLSEIKDLIKQSL